MKSMASYFSISVPIIKENLRRFWSIPVLGTLVYFLCGVFPILMRYNNIDEMYDYINMCLTNQHPFFIVTHLVLPIITAVVVFRYLHNSSSVTATHALPFTRAQLFNSNLISGFIISFIPLIINELLLQLIAKPTYPTYITDGYNSNSYSTISEISSGSIPDAFSHLNVLDWFWQSVLVVAVIYIIAVFAGMVTGNVIMHISLGFAFNFLLPALYLTFIGYCDKFLFGFTATGSYERILLGMMPLTQAIASDESFSIHLQLYYIAVIIFFIVVSSILYHRRRFETSGDSIVFSFMVPTICYLIAFFGMSLLGYYFITLCVDEQKDLYFYSGLFAGGLISFVIGRMIVFKTPKVFNKHTLKSFCIFAIIATIYTTSITLDLTGFENRVPIPNKVSSVESLFFDFNEQWARYDMGLFRGYNPNENERFFKYKDPENIKAIIDLHKFIVDHKESIEEHMKRNVTTYPMDFYYKISNPLGMQRSYTLTYDTMKTNKSLKQLYESEEFKTYFSYSNLNCQRISSVTLNNLNYYDYDFDIDSRLVLKDKQLISNLITVMEKDFQTRTFEQHTSTLRPYCSISITYKYLDENEKLTDYTLEVKVLESDKNTIQWLNDNGYNTHLVCTSSDIQKITFKEWDAKAEVEKSSKSDEAYEVKEFTTVDKQQIQEILDTFEYYETNYDHYYEGTIWYKSTSLTEGSFTKRIVYNVENVPDFIKDYFTQ